MKRSSTDDLAAFFARQKAPREANSPTGPKTGLTASVQARFALTGEAKARFEELLEIYKLEFKPQGQLEADLFLQYVWSIYSLERATRMESEEMMRDFSPESLKTLERLQLYRQRHERNALRLKKELGQAQKDRYAANEVNRLLEKQGFCHNVSTAQPTFDMRFPARIGNVFHTAAMHRDGLCRWPGEHGRAHVTPEVFAWCAQEDLRQAALVS